MPHCTVLGPKLIAAIAAAAFCLPVAGHADDASELADFRKAQELGQARLAKFDTLDFDVFSNQKWDRLSEAMPRISPSTGPMAIRPRASTSMSRI